MRDLSGTTVAVTGASAGIGAATARSLAAAGANVVLGARRVERLDALVDELGEQALAVPMDVRRPADAETLVRTAVERYGRLDSLVANAGIGMYGGILDRSDDELATMLDTNVAGTVWPVRATVRHFLDRGPGSEPASESGGVPTGDDDGAGDVVIVSSVAGLRGGADEAVYAATKFAQVGLAGSLDRELREHGVRVTAICPAGVHTEFALGAGRTAGDPALEEYLRPEDVAEAIRVVLEQPRRMRTQLWSMWSMQQGS